MKSYKIKYHQLPIFYIKRKEPKKKRKEKNMKSTAPTKT